MSGRECPLENTATVQQNRRATELEAYADPHYNHLQKDSTPAVAMQQYASLNQPEIREYESVSEMK